jgi:hypothetical protein
MHSTHPEMGHGLRCRQTTFTKQVSRPVDNLDPPSWPPRPRRSNELEEGPGHGPIRGICALQGRCRPIMFTKQVSRPMNTPDHLSWPRRLSRSGNSNQDLVTGAVRVSCAYSLCDVLLRHSPWSRRFPPMLSLDLPRPKKFGDSRRRQHLYSPESGAAGAMDCFTPWDEPAYPDPSAAAAGAAEIETTTRVTTAARPAASRIIRRIVAMHLQG